MTTRFSLRVEVSENKNMAYGMIQSIFREGRSIAGNRAINDNYVSIPTTDAEILFKLLHIESTAGPISQEQLFRMVVSKLNRVIPNIQFIVLESAESSEVYLDQLYPLVIHNYLLPNRNITTTYYYYSKEYRRQAGDLLGSPVIYTDNNHIFKQTALQHVANIVRFRDAIRIGEDVSFRNQAQHLGVQTKAEFDRDTEVLKNNLVGECKSDRIHFPIGSNNPLEILAFLGRFDDQIRKEFDKQTNESDIAEKLNEFEERLQKLESNNSNTPSGVTDVRPSKTDTSESDNDRFQKGIRILACFESHIAPEQYIEHLNGHFELGETVPGFDPRAVLHNRTSFFIKDSKVYATSHFDRIRTWSDTQKLFDPCMFVSGFIEAAVVVQDNYFDGDYTVIVYPGSNAEQAVELKRQFKDTLIHNIENSFA